jgi:hypothetical protein
VYGAEPCGREESKVPGMKGKARMPEALALGDVAPGGTHIAPALKGLFGKDAAPLSAHLFLGQDAVAAGRHRRAGEDAYAASRG